RHLRGEQIVGRVRFRLARPTPDLRPAPPTRRPAAPWVTPAARAPSFDAPETFTFLNETHGLAEIGWDDPAIAKLWRYNLHYFDDLAAAGAAARRTDHSALITRWIAENPPARGTGWEPYPASLRIISWIKWLMAGASPVPGMLDSLAAQIRWLTQRLEWHLLGNHLFINAKALLLAGLFFDGEEAAGWRATAIAILERELPEQILADGGQFERSPMYHALALEDVLDLINALSTFGTPGRGEQRLDKRLRDIAPGMLRWLRAMVFPDGGVTHFNDSADGIAPPVAEIERYAAALGLTAEAIDGGTTHLADSGYVRLAAGRAIAWLDVGPIGPDYLPGHAHADTLSFELAVDGQAVIVNGGTSCYGLGEQRLIERGTAMHNSVQLDDHDSSEVWSGFRVGRRARPFTVRVEEGRVEAAHDGYRFLPGRPVHRRRWELSDDGLLVEDRVDPPFAGAVARYRLAPGLTAEPAATGWIVRSGDRHLATVEVEGATVEWQVSEHAPEFGVRQPVQLMCCTMTDGRCVTRWLWAG
ncbi:MAG: alginate lyase family protein, partial [Sphingomonadaceae bacterium]|nr:alginate lyase family protein [Sphingomonadaceae bacterium]